jgi:hypothetical protein
LQPGKSVDCPDLITQFNSSGWLRLKDYNSSKTEPSTLQQKIATGLFLLSNLAVALEKFSSTVPFID